jgi:ferredoxin
LNLFNENNPKKGALNLIPHFPDPGVYEMKVCTQCGECAAVCPVGAIHQDDKGAYYVAFDECTLCENCVPVCPENVMFVRTELAASAWKCNLCGDCVKVCGTDVLRIAE